MNDRFLKWNILLCLILPILPVLFLYLSSKIALEFTRNQGDNPPGVIQSMVSICAFIKRLQSFLFLSHVTQT